MLWSIETLSKKAQDRLVIARKVTITVGVIGIIFYWVNTIVRIKIPESIGPSRNAIVSLFVYFPIIF